MLYRSYKLDFSREPYIDCVRDFKLRRCISKFRLSSHKLAIETGRHFKPKIPREKRLCVYCNLNRIEDEVHLMVECPFYLTERVHFLVKVLSIQRCIFDDIDIHCSKDVFKIIMDTKDEDMLFYLGKFLYSCFKKREAY